jgi:hypothetical protein
LPLKVYDARLDQGLAFRLHVNAKIVAVSFKGKDFILTMISTTIDGKGMIIQISHSYNVRVIHSLYSSKTLTL